MNVRVGARLSCIAIGKPSAQATATSRTTLPRFPGAATRSNAARASVSGNTESTCGRTLNMSYMAEQLSLFGIVVGIALLLSGIGFIVLALGVLQRDGGAAAPA